MWANLQRRAPQVVARLRRPFAPRLQDGSKKHNSIQSQFYLDIIIDCFIKDHNIHASIYLLSNCHGYVGIVIIASKSPFTHTYIIEFGLRPTYAYNSSFSPPAEMMIIVEGGPNYNYNFIIPNYNYECLY